MSEKIELIAAAQVTVVGGSPGSISFASNHGFDTASRGGPGSYELTLEHKHDSSKLVVNVTRNGSTSGDIEATVGAGDTKSILVTSNPGDAPTDTSFFISVLRVRS